MNNPDFQVWDFVVVLVCFKLSFSLRSHGTGSGSSLRFQRRGSVCSKPKRRLISKFDLLRW